MKFNHVKMLIIIVLVCLGNALGAEPVTLRVGHVGHDHHAALFVALDQAENYEATTGLKVKTVRDREAYELFDKAGKIADLQIVKVGGGSRMPTALAQNVIDVGLGGVAPVLAAVDQGMPIKLISPLHYKGDLLVVKPDFPAKTWAEFVQVVRNTKTPIRIGYKSPMAVAKLVFEEALKHEGLSYGGDSSNQELDIHMVCTKGGGKLNVALGSGLVQGYVGNTPFPGIGMEKGVGRIVCDLEELPPGTFKDHPCCCIAATTQAIRDKGPAIAAVLKLCVATTQALNSDPQSLIKPVCHWTGASEAVELMSLPCNGYGMTPTAYWHATMDQWIKAMNGLSAFKDRLKGLPALEVRTKAYDLSLLQQVLSDMKGPSS